MEQDSEVQVGITKFLNDFPPAPCSYKYRFSDFIVEEIDLEGNILKCDLDAHAGKIQFSLTV